MDKNIDYNYFGMPPFGNGNMYDMNGDYGIHVLSLFKHANGI